MTFAAIGARSQSYVTAPLADGFDYPVGKPDAKNYYTARGFIPHGHMGEDWNGTGGGNTDEGDPIYNIAHGVVLFSQDYKRGWGNVVIIRHAFRGSNGQISFVDSLYGHLKVRLVKVGDKVLRGQKIGTMGCGPHRMYLAHLHFEIRKDLRVGMRRDLYPKTYATYHSPRYFIDQHRKLRYESRTVRMPINTFQKSSNPNKVYTTKIEVPDVETEAEVKPAVPETVSTVIASEVEEENATPEKSKSLLEKLFGK
ncbi:MAG: M23 family metallopeptidase [Verrucomicrobiota bacterium]